MTQSEYLVTGQGYDKQDPYKQSIILYDVFKASSENDAKEQFNNKFATSHSIMNIYSAENIDQI